MPADRTSTAYKGSLEAAQVPAVNAGLVFVLDVAGKVTGAGFLAGERSIVTCAHVASNASDPASHPELIGRLIRVYFPALGQRAEHIGTVKFVIGGSLKDDDDLCLIELERGEPQARPLPLSHDESFPIGQELLAIGAPFEGLPRPEVTRCVATADLQAAGIQLEQAGPLIRPGYSGSPLWDVKRRLVVGMIRDCSNHTRTIQGVKASTIRAKLQLARLPPTQPLRAITAAAAKRFFIDVVRRHNDEIETLGSSSTLRLEGHDDGTWWESDAKWFYSLWSPPTHQLTGDEDDLWVEVAYGPIDMRNTVRVHEWLVRITWSQDGIDGYFNISQEMRHALKLRDLLVRECEEHFRHKLDLPFPAIVAIGETQWGGLQVSATIAMEDASARSVQAVGDSLVLLTKAFDDFLDRVYELKEFAAEVQSEKSDSRLHFRYVEQFLAKHRIGKLPPEKLKVFESSRALVAADVWEHREIEAKQVFHDFFKNDVDNEPRLKQLSEEWQALLRGPVHLWEARPKRERLRVKGHDYLKGMYPFITVGRLKTADVPTRDPLTYVMLLFFEWVRKLDSERSSFFADQVTVSTDNVCVEGHFKFEDISVRAGDRQQYRTMTYRLDRKMIAAFSGPYLYIVMTGVPYPENQDSKYLAHVDVWLKAFELGRDRNPTR